jgi:hypothetical protein
MCGAKRSPRLRTLSTPVVAAEGQNRLSGDLVALPATAVIVRVKPHCLLGSSPRKAGVLAASVRRSECILRERSEAGGSFTAALLGNRTRQRRRFAMSSYDGKRDKITHLADYSREL